VVCKHDRSQQSFKGIVRREKWGSTTMYFGMNRVVSTTQTTADVSGQFKGPWLFKLQNLSQHSEGVFTELLFPA
jgi:hypothetical protein